MRFTGWFQEPEPASRPLPRTTDASSGPSPATPCTATGLPELSSRIDVVNGTENKLLAQLQNAGRAFYPELAGVETMRIDYGGAHTLVAE